MAEINQPKLSERGYGSSTKEEWTVVDGRTGGWTHWVRTTTAGEIERRVVAD